MCLFLLGVVCGEELVSENIYKTLALLIFLHGSGICLSLCEGGITTL